MCVVLIDLQTLDAKIKRRKRKLISQITLSGLKVKVMSQSAKGRKEKSGGGFAGEQ